MNSLVKQYQQDGVVLIRNLLQQSDLDLLATGIENNLLNPTRHMQDYARHDSAGGEFFHDAHLFTNHAEFWQVAKNSSLAATAAQFMQSNSATGSHVTVFVRSPGTRARTPWHCDQEYWPYQGSQTCSIWIPLDPITSETSLEFVRGSHRWDQHYLQPVFNDKEQTSQSSENATTFPDIESSRDQFEIIGFELEPGDCLLFHGMTAHGGSGNLPPGTGRRCISYQWFGDDVVFTPTPKNYDPNFVKEMIASGAVAGHSPRCGVCPQVWPAAN